MRVATSSYYTKAMEGNKLLCCPLPGMTTSLHLVSSRWNNLAALFLSNTVLSPKRPLPDLARTLDEPAHQVRRHEQASVLRVVLVPANPEGPSLGIKHLPELLHAVLV